MSEPDIGLSWKTSPPLVVPISQRARDILNLPAGVDCAVFLEEEPERVMSIFPDDLLIISMEEDYNPKLIATATIKQLH